MILRNSIVVLFFGMIGRGHAFLSISSQIMRTNFLPSITRLAAATSPESMRVAELKRELESYGISTKSFFEKKELVQALQRARDEGLQPKQQRTTTTTSNTSATSSNAKKTNSKDETKRLEDELSACQKLSVRELKKELSEFGVSTAALLEKSDLVKALAKARVAENDVEAVQVEVLTDAASGPRKRSDEATKKRGGGPFEGVGAPFGQEVGSSVGSGGNPFGGGGKNPFGGGGKSPFGGGGMGGMGGIADVIMNMGGGSGSTVNPFAGSANPFGGGDVMGQAQKMMSNPKVRELVMKAQSNPRIMSKVQECMSNPASFAKYQNDPEVAELIAELKKFM